MKRWYVLAALPFLCFASHSQFDLGETHKELIEEFVTQFHKESYVQLVENTDTIVVKLSTLLDTSPFDWLGCLLSDPLLSQKLREGLTDPAKSTLFLQGFGFCMMQHRGKEGFSEELDLFCTQFNLKTHVMNLFVQKGDWNRFLHYCLKGEKQG